MTGLPRSRARTTSRQIDSEATAEPPGLSMRNRIARTLASRKASRNARVTSRALISAEPENRLAEPPPWTISPVPYISAIVGPLLCGWSAPSR